MMKKWKRFLSGLLILVMVFSMSGLLGLTAFAADPKQAGTQAELENALLSGGVVQLKADISCSGGLGVSADTTIDVCGHTLTIAADPNSGAGIGVSGGELTLTDSVGTGKIAITSSYWGISYGGDVKNGLVLNHVDLEITGASRVALFSAAVGRPITMNGGKLIIKNCGTTDVGWGAVRWGFSGNAYGGPVAFNSGIVDIEDNGYNWINFYISHDVVFGDGGSEPLTVTLKNAATAGTGYENTLQLTQIAGVKNGLTIHKNADVHITLTGTAGQRRGINSDGAPVVIDGGKLTIDSEYTGDGNTYGLRGINATVKNGGVLNIQGVKYGVAPRSNPASLTVPDGSLVTIESSGGKDSAEPSVITGGSVKMDDAYSIVSGAEVNAAADKVDPTPVNASGEPLTRFDLPGMAGKSIEVAADPADPTAHPAYSYPIGADHSGTAYVWAPAVKINFLSPDGSLLQTNDTIRGNSLSFVGGAVPEFPDNIRVLPGSRPCWINAATGKVFDPSAAVLGTTNVYIGSAYLIPIDLLEGTSLDASGKSYVNGPVTANTGDRVYCKATIDLLPIANFLRQYYNDTTGYLDGEYTITLRCSDALTPALNSPSTNIGDYFNGPAAALFTLAEAPVVSGKTVTFKVRFIGQSGPNESAVTGGELANILADGMWLYASKNFYTTVGNISSPGYGRITAALSGQVRFVSVNVIRIKVIHTPDRINMIGFQKPDSDEGIYVDPTLGTVGSDPADAVSATVLKEETPAYNVHADFNRTEHMSYIIGYENDLVRPEQNITRAETATIFFRLLTDASRKSFWKTSGSFPDVTADKWYCNAVFTMENAGFVTGYPDGTFGGGRPITRAEFAAIAARANGADGKYTGADKFSDMSGHWAAAYINEAAEMGLVGGYPDGSFHPNAYITRAEAMTLVNRFLDRDKITAACFLSDMLKWRDNADPAAWYYCAVQEATNSHDYTRGKDGMESWTKINLTPDWKALETKWSTANSASR
jgi:hypothetical protein